MNNTAKSKKILQAFLWYNEPAYQYFLVLSLHLVSFGCLHFVKAPGNKFETIIASFLARCDNYKQLISGNLANTRTLIGAILSVANLIFTAVEMHVLVRECFKSLISYRVFAVQFRLLLLQLQLSKQLGVCSQLWFANRWLDHLHLLGSSLAPALALDDQQLHKNPGDPQEAY